MKKIFTATLFVTVLSAFSTIVFAQTESRENLLQDIEAKRAELATLEKKFLSPSEEDRAAHAEFLKEPDTGLIRLLPRDIFDEVYRTGKGLTMIGGGAYYSFSRLTHDYGFGSDLEFDHKYLSVGFAGVDFGMLTNLGDVPLELITPESPRARFMSAYVPPVSETDARSEKTRFMTGLTSDGGLYKQRLPMQVNSAYLLRSINYSSSASDVLVAFRVVRKDTDDSIIILWKLLKKYPKPELARSN